MSKAAISLLAYAIYLLVLGATLVLAPNALLVFFGFSPTGEVWVRVLGVIILILATYDILAARIELIPFFRWSVYVRPMLLVFFLAFVALRLVQPILLLFGVMDVLAAAWTGLALRADDKGRI